MLFICAIQCQEECNELYIGETKQPLHKRKSQPRCATSSGQLHLKESGRSFEDSQVCVVARKERWFKKSVKEAIHVKLKKPSLNRGGGLRHLLSPTYNAVLRSLGQHSKCLRRWMRPDASPSCDPADKEEGSQQKLDEPHC